MNDACEPMQELIALDAGGDLDGAEKRRLDRHLAGCGECRRSAAGMQRSRRAVRRLAEEPVDRDALAAVRAAVLDEIRGSGRRAPSLLRFPRRPAAASRRWQAAAAAALLLTAAAGWWLARRPPPSPKPLPEVVRYEPPPLPRESPPTAAPPAIAETAAPQIPKAVEPAPPEMRPTPVAAAASAAPRPQPMVVKWLVDDPDLVIYWLIETEEATEETTHEPTEA